MNNKYRPGLVILLLASFFLTTGMGWLPPWNGGAQQLRVCSFNIRVFSDNNRDNEELAHIVNILKEYDLIAIQELRDEEVLLRTVAALKERGCEYKYEISPKVGRGVKEIYAFLYRPDKVAVVKKGRLYQDQNDEFIREPFYATFKAGDFDFTLVTIHLLYGSSENERRPELVALARVYKEVQDEEPNEQDIIILGDFNFPPTDAGWDGLKSFRAMIHLISPPSKTTVTDTSLFDNFWFQAEYVKEYAGGSGINMFDEEVFGNNDNEAKLAVSDHRPIWAVFNTNLGDDD